MAVKVHRGMARGDVLARGNRVDVNRDGFVAEEECEFDFGIEITLVSGSRTVEIGRGPGCTAVIEEIRDLDAVEPEDAGHGAANRPPAPSRVRGLLARLRDLVLPTASAQSYTRRIVYQHVYSYGFAGVLADGLTAQQGWLDFRYNGFDAIQNGGGGWACTSGYNSAGSPNCIPPLGIPPMFSQNLGWLAYNFFIAELIWGPATPYVQRTDYSSFRFQPTQGGPLQYQHTLHVRRRGFNNGSGSCLSWVTGTYVWGVVASACSVYFP